MKVLVDTCVWSLAIRRNHKPGSLPLPAVTALHDLLLSDNLVVTTPIIVQELLQGSLPTNTRKQVESQLLSIPMLTADIDTHVEAAHLQLMCKQKGVALGTVDSLIAAVAISEHAYVFTVNQDFYHAAPIIDLPLYSTLD